MPVSVRLKFVCLSQNKAGLQTVVLLRRYSFSLQIQICKHDFYRSTLTTCSGGSRNGQGGHLPTWAFKNFSVFKEKRSFP